MAPTSPEEWKAHWQEDQRAKHLYDYASPMYWFLRDIPRPKDNPYWVWDQSTTNYHLMKFHSFLQKDSLKWSNFGDQ